MPVSLGHREESGRSRKGHAPGAASHEDPVPEEHGAESGHRRGWRRDLGTGVVAGRGRGEALCDCTTRC